MKELLVLTWLFLALTHSAYACSEANGGCSHICIERNSTINCHCPCGFTLSNDNTTCQPENNCATEYYIVIDVFLHATTDICTDKASGNSDKFNSFFLVWRYNILAVLEMMTEYHSNSPTNAKYYVKTLDTSTSLIKRLGTGLDEVKNFVNSLTAAGIKNSCDNDVPGSYADSLSSVITDGGFNTDRDSTTRIALFMLGKTGSITNSDLSSRTDILKTNFDYTVVWSNKAVTGTSTIDSVHVNHLRSLACGRSTVSSDTCLKLFWFDYLTDENLAPTIDTLYKVVNTEVCKHRDTPTYTLESCGPGMNIRVDKCLLGGLDPAQDFVLIDDTCSPEVTNTASVDTDGYYDLRVPYGSCGTSFRYNKRGDLEMIFGNTISVNESVVTTQTPFELEVTCTVKTTSDPVLSVEFGPGASFIRSITNVTDNNLPDVELKFYSDSSRLTEIGSTDMIATGAKVYGKASSSFPESLVLRLTKLEVDKVYPFSDPVVNFGYCPQEPTTVVNHIGNQEVLFEFEMFEWASDQDKDDSLKSPVYIEATFHVCDENDTSSECQVFSCGLGRHKREVSETKTVKTVVRALNLNSVAEETLTHVSEKKTDVPPKKINIMEAIIVKFKNVGRIDFLGTWSNFVLLLSITFGALLNSILLSKYFGQNTKK